MISKTKLGRFAGDYLSGSLWDLDDDALWPYIDWYVWNTVDDRLQMRLLFAIVDRLIDSLREHNE